MNPWENGYRGNGQRGFWVNGVYVNAPLPTVRTGLNQIWGQPQNIRVNVGPGAHNPIPYFAYPNYGSYGTHPPVMRVVLRPPSPLRMLGARAQRAQFVEPMIIPNQLQRMLAARVLQARWTGELQNNHAAIVPGDFHEYFNPSFFDGRIRQATPAQLVANYLRPSMLLAPVNQAIWPEQLQNIHDNVRPINHPIVNHYPYQNYGSPYYHWPPMVPAEGNQAEGNGQLQNITDDVRRDIAEGRLTLFSYQQSGTTYFTYLPPNPERRNVFERERLMLFPLLISEITGGRAIYIPPELRRLLVYVRPFNPVIEGYQKQKLGRLNVSWDTSDDGRENGQDRLLLWAQDQRELRLNDPAYQRQHFIINRPLSPVSSYQLEGELVRGHPPPPIDLRHQQLQGINFNFSLTDRHDLIERRYATSSPIGGGRAAEFVCNQSDILPDEES